MGRIVIEAKQIRKEYWCGNEKNSVIKRIDVAFTEGTKNAIIGRSGSGKSTLLSILEGILEPNGGNVLFEEQDYYSMTEAEQSKIRGKFYGIVFQDYQLIPEITILDNIKLPSLINEGSFDVIYYKELIELLGLQGVTSKFPDQLSGGEQQRVAIARAMVKKPKVLFADEPTGNLDEASSKIIMEMFDVINKKYGTTIIMVTHDEEMISDWDKIFKMSDGKLVNIKE